MHRSPLRILLLLALCTACEDNPSGAKQTGDFDGASPAATSVFTDSTPIASSRPLMIEFTRDYCLPCQVMAPWVAELRREQAGNVDVVEVNVDREKNQQLALFFTIKSVPTQVFVHPSGHIEAKHEGIATKEEMMGTFTRLGWIP